MTQCLACMHARKVHTRTSGAQGGVVPRSTAAVLLLPQGDSCVSSGVGKQLAGLPWQGRQAPPRCRTTAWASQPPMNGRPFAAPMPTSGRVMLDATLCLGQHVAGMRPVRVLATTCRCLQHLSGGGGAHPARAKEPLRCAQGSRPSLCMQRSSPGRLTTLCMGPRSGRTRGRARCAQTTSGCPGWCTRTNAATRARLRRLRW